LRKKPLGSIGFGVQQLENRYKAAWLYRIAVAANFFTMASRSLRSLSFRLLE